MKNLTLLNDNTNIKLNDTGTVIQFKASNEGQPIGLSNGQSATFRIKNELGFLKSVNANSSYGGYVFELDTEDLKSLVPDTYQVELLIQVDSDNALIFPDKGFVQFTINENALNITGEQLPVMSLEDFKDELKTYVDNQTTTATTNIKNDFDTYVDNLTDSTITTATKASQDAQTAINTANSANAAAQNATNIANAAKSNADSASQTATNAQTAASDANAIANTAKSTADTALSKASTNASAIASNTSSIKTNSDSINGGLYLDRAKSYAQINSSKNLVVNSEMQTKQDSDDPYSNWDIAWGWTTINSPWGMGRNNIDGKNCIQCLHITATSPMVSTGLCVGKINESTILSSRIYYRKDSNFNSGQIMNFYIEYAHQSTFVNSQKVLVGTVDENSVVNGYVTRENITIPQHYDWIRIRVESNQANDAPWLWIGEPMINYGSTIQDYVISNLPGQRIAAIESDIADLKSQIQTLKNQLSGNN